MPICDHTDVEGGEEIPFLKDDPSTKEFTDQSLFLWPVAKVLESQLLIYLIKQRSWYGWLLITDK